MGLFQVLFSALKFYALGIANFFLFLSLFYITNYVLKWHYIPSSAVSYTVVIITACVGNVFWVFNQHSKMSHQSKALLLFKTLMVYLSSLIMELLSLYLIVILTKGNVFMVQLIVYILSSLYCFLMIHYRVFKHHK